MFLNSNWPVVVILLEPISKSEPVTAVIALASVWYRLVVPSATVSEFPCVYVIAPVVEL